MLTRYRLQLIGNVDTTRVLRKNVRVAYLIRCPYRIATGRLFHLSRERKGNLFDIYFLNEFVVGADEVIPEHDWHLDPPPELCTDLVIVLRNPAVPSNLLERFPSLDGYPLYQLSRDVDSEILDIYRQLLIAIDSWIPEAAHLYGTYAPSRSEFEEEVVAIVWLVCPEELELDENHLADISALKHEEQLRSTLGVIQSEERIRQAFGETGLTASAIDQLQSALDTQERYIHYELLHQSRIEKLRQEYPTCLIVAVSALEAVQAALIDLAVDELLPADARSRDHVELRERLLREHGLSSLIRLTPFLLLRAELQPTFDLVRKCLRAFSMRNAIVHALRDSKGMPKSHGYTDSEYVEVIEALNELYELFAYELEIRLGVESSISQNIRSKRSQL